MPGDAAILSPNDSVVSLLQQALASAGLRSVHLSDTAIEPPRNVDLLVVDLTSASEQHLDDLHAYRSARPELAIIVYGGEASALATAALEEGADVHVPAGVRASHIAAQIRALRRRTARPEPENIKIGMLELNINAREASARDRPLRLTAGEFKVLAYLAENVGRVVSHTDIYYAMHQESLTDGDSREPVKVLISRLRLKLDEAKL
ncbi:MAG TPA: winged helix-turn-helix domain-containing protein, partial [Dehalococcoidia bacterium]|nr:winged helix-turn-helix domain-containing protein [Dehalococcoidia bacterium]